jgi:hypothetical protein
VTPCTAEVAATNEDGSLLCDLQQDHLGDHWDPEYGIHFRTPGTTPH